MMSRCKLRLAFAVFSILVGGCTDGSNMATVSGNVTVDGASLKSGLVRFVPADGQTASADAQIADGKYSVELPPGDKKLSFSVPKVVGQKKMYDTPDSPMIDITEELLPAKYNLKSELTYTVSEGDQTKDFELTTK